MEDIKLSKKTVNMQKFCSKGECRPNIEGVYFSDNHVCATNGHVLAVSASDNKELKETSIVFDKKMPSKLKEDNFIVRDNSLIGEESKIGASKSEEKTYPDFDRVIPLAEDVKEDSITLSAKYLKDIAEYYLSLDKKASITILVTDNLSPALFSSDEDSTLIALMPMRVESRTIIKDNLERLEKPEQEKEE